MLDVILEAILDTLKVIPVLLLVYILIEFLTHHKKEPFSFITGKGKKFGPLFGSVLGSIPQCGFSAAMADLYAQRKITLGTLFAVFIATSDEAIPILIANPSRYVDMIILIGFKFVFGLIFGYIIDGILNKKTLEKIKKRFTKSNNYKNEHEHAHEHEHDHHQHGCGNCCGHNHEQHNNKQSCGHDHCCADNIFYSACLHTLKIAAFILIINLVLGIVIHLVKLETFLSAISINPYLQPLITCLIGLIPNCAGSVFLVEIFLEGGISLAATIGGLSAGSGLGILILFRKNKNIKENILILVSIYIIGVLIGLTLTPFLA